MKKTNPLKKIVLYNDPSNKTFNITEIKRYISSLLPNIDLEVRNEFFYYYTTDSHTHTPTNSNTLIPTNSLTELATKIANTKVRDINDPAKRITPLLGEITLEMKLLSDPTKALPGIFYDGIRLNNVFQEFLTSSEIDPSICHIVFTPRLFGTFDRFDRRYHARVILCSLPSMISTSGIVEAPAKPKEYYRVKQDLLRQNITTIDDFIPDKLKQKYIKYDDSRLTEVLKGYLMQAIFYQLLSEPFCSEPRCRLFNAHWQEEVLEAQLTSPEFCEKHQQLITQFNH